MSPKKAFIYKYVALFKKINITKKNFKKLHFYEKKVEQPTIYM